MAVRNTLVDLHNILFEQLENLCDDEIMDNPEQNEKELKKAIAIKEIAKVIVTNASIMLKAEKFKADSGATPNRVLIGDKNQMEDLNE